MLQPTIRNNLRFDYDQHAWAVLVGFQMGRLELIFHNQSFDPEMNRLLADTQVEIISNIKPVLQAKGIILNDEVDEYQQMVSALNRDLELLSARIFSFYLIGLACIRINMAHSESAQNYELIPLARSCIESIPAQYLQDKEEFFQELFRRNYQAVVHITDYLTELNQQSILRDQRASQQSGTYLRKEQIQKLIAQHKENIYELELQKAKYGPDPPIYIVNALKDAKSEVEKLEQELQSDQTT